MTIAQTTVETPSRPIRLWPGVIAAALSCASWFVVPLFPGGGPFAVLGGMLFAVVILLWWLFFSRSPWSERIGPVVLIAIAIVLGRQVVHASVQNGMMGMMLMAYATPAMAVALVAWAAATRGLSTGVRRVSLAATILLACGRSR